MLWRAWKLLEYWLFKNSFWKRTLLEKSITLTCKWTRKYRLNNPQHCCELGHRTLQWLQVRKTHLSSVYRFIWQICSLETSCCFQVKHPINSCNLCVHHQQKRTANLPRYLWICQIFEWHLHPAIILQARNRHSHSNYLTTH